MDGHTRSVRALAESDHTAGTVRIYCFLKPSMNPGRYPFSISFTTTSGVNNYSFTDILARQRLSREQWLPSILFSVISSTEVTHKGNIITTEFSYRRAEKWIQCSLMLLQPQVLEASRSLLGCSWRSNKDGLGRDLAEASAQQFSLRCFDQLDNPIGI